MLIDALCDKTVGFHELANSIANKNFMMPLEPITLSDNVVQSSKGFECPLCGTCSLEKYHERKCPKFRLLSDSAFPFLNTSMLTEDEKFTLHGKLIEETDNINQKFNNLVYQVSVLLDAMIREKLKNVTKFLKYQLAIKDSSLHPHPDADTIMECLCKVSEHHLLTIGVFGSLPDSTAIIDLIILNTYYRWVDT